MDALLRDPTDTLRYIQLAKDFTNFTITNEGNLYMTGFGYSLFLSVLLVLLGMSFKAVMFVQVVMSAITTVLIYKVALMITGKRTVGLIAGLINATSLTAITLTVSFLSESLFVFLLVSAIYLFLRSVKLSKLSGFILLGLIISYIVFTRSVGLFLPFVFVLALVVIPGAQLPRMKKKKLLGYSIITAALAFTLISAWSFRNYLKHDTFVAAGTGPGAAASYLGARVAADRADSLSIYDCRAIFLEEFLASKDGPLTRGEQNEWYINKVKSLFVDDPISFTITFLSIVKENMFAPDQYTQLRMPKKQHWVRQYISFSFRNNFHLVLALMSSVGAATLVFKRYTLGAATLILCYLGIAFTSGFTFWQGSRIFYPAQVAWSVFVAVAIYYPFMALSSRFTWYVWPRCLSFMKNVSRAAWSAIWYPNEYLRFSKQAYRKILIFVFIALVAMLHISVVIPRLRPANYTQIEGVAGHFFGKSVEIAEIKLEEVAESTKLIIFNFKVHYGLSDSYRVFLHFRPAGKSNSINRDFALTIPTPYWHKGMQVSERVELDLEPGVYTARMGFFNGQIHLEEPLYFQITVR